MITNILIALAVVLGAVIFNWQRDKTSFLQAAKDYWLQYIAVFVVTGFLTGYLLESELGHRIFQIAIGFAIVVFWGIIFGWLKKKV